MLLNVQIKVGDQLVKLNGEDLTEVLPKDCELYIPIKCVIHVLVFLLLFIVVSMIRAAPNPSTFLLVEGIQ